MGREGEETVLEGEGKEETLKKETKCKQVSVNDVITHMVVLQVIFNTPCVHLKPHQPHDPHQN